VKKNILLIVVFAVVLLVVVSLFGALLAGAKSGFHKELAKRLEFEEKLLKTENERAAAMSQLETLREELSKNKQEMSSLANELDRERKDKEAAALAVQQNAIAGNVLTPAENK
jgi:septal ring factor EnvC (AmiA/AmiB activator)